MAAGYERPDYWTLRAKKEGYPARSVYKLEEIVRKFGLLKGIGGGRGGVSARASAVDDGADLGRGSDARGTSGLVSTSIERSTIEGGHGGHETTLGSRAPRGLTILDVGAAPGSWSLWLLRQLKERGTLVAVDIQDLGIAPADSNFSFLKGSILDEPVRARLRERGPYDLVVSDAAPATSGNRLVDQARSEELVEAVMGLALEVLAPGGALVMKIFQGGEEKRLISELRGHFAQARAFKPEACRAESFETYLVATGFAHQNSQKAPN